MRLIINSNDNDKLFAKNFPDVSYDAFAQTAEKVAKDKLAELKVMPSSIETVTVSLTFCGCDQIRALNSQYREVDASTDVLSFPLWENQDGLFEPDETMSELPLGDIVVCLDEVAKNAGENGKTAFEELALVVFHGVLHLIGYDHDTESKQAEMWALQDEMVSRFVAEQSI